MKREYVIRKDRLEGKRIVEVTSKKLDTDRYNPKLLAERGYGYSLMEEYDKAMEDLNLSIQEDSTDENSYIIRGNCLVRMEEYDEAIEDFNEAIYIEEHNPRPYFHRGYCHQQLGEYDEALKNYKDALEINLYVKEKDQLFHKQIEKKIAEIEGLKKTMILASKLRTAGVKNSGVRSVVYNL